jgi:hypothetical protein
VTALPFHPITGLQALDFTKRGLPIWPVMGGSGEDGGSGDDGGGNGDGDAGDGGDQGQGGDQDKGGGNGNSDRGFPENTPIVEMTAEERANYFKFHDRRKGDKLKDYDGITPEQAKQFRDAADKARRDGLQPDERALEDARTEATAAAMQAAAQQWAPEFARQVIGQFVTDKDQQNSILAGLDPMKFVKDGRFDTDALVGHMTGLAAAFGGGDAGNGNQPRQWGQSGDRPPAPKASDLGLAEAKRRGYIK